MKIKDERETQKNKKQKTKKKRNYKPSPRILRQHRVLRNLRKSKDIIITKPDKENGVVILDRKLYDNAIQDIISDTFKLEKLKLRKLKGKNFFNENEYNKLYPSGSAPARIYNTPKMHKLFSSDSFPKLRPIVSSIGTFKYNLAPFLCDFLSPLVLNDYSMFLLHHRLILFLTVNFIKKLME